MTDNLMPRVPPPTCEDKWHISRMGRKYCDCGENRNPSYRNLFQRIKDRWEFRKVSRR